MIEVRLGVGTPGFMRRGELRLQRFVLADQRGMVARVDIEKLRRQGHR